MPQRTERPVSMFLLRAVLSLSAAASVAAGLLISAMPILLPFMAVAAFLTAWILLSRTDAWKGAFRDFSRIHAVAAASACCAGARGIITDPAGLYGGVWMTMFSVAFVLAVPAMYFLAYVVYAILYRILRRFVSGQDQMSRREFAATALTALLFLAAMLAAFARSDMLYRGDSVYTFDSILVLGHDVFFYPTGWDNDIRSIFFGLSTMPLAALLHLAADVFAVFSGFDIYPHLIGALQCLAMAFSVMLLSRMLSKNTCARAMFWMLFAGSYMTVLNVLMVEQFVFSVFWLVLFLYLYLEDGLGFDADACCLLACGCMMTSLFALVPVFLWDGRKAWKHAGKCLFWAVCILLLSGQGVWVVYTLLESNMYTRFLGGVSVGRRLWEFSWMVRSVFLAPPSRGMFQGFPIDDAPGPWAVWQMDCPMGFDPIGVAIIAAMAVGFIYGRRSRFIRLCGWWAVSSVLITCVFGWGLSESGLVIYCFYFGWAYLCLLAKFLEWLLRGNGMAMICAGSVLSVAMLAYNISEISAMLEFIARYPNVDHDPPMVHLQIGRCCSAD